MSVSLPDPYNLIGTLLSDRYRVVRLLGQGGMGSVWLAVDERLGEDRKVVIKIPHPHLLTRDDAALRFAKEIENLARLNLPGVVRILDLGQWGEIPFFVLEHLGGGNLGERLERRGRKTGSARRTPRELMKIVHKLCRILDLVHEQGIVHRDIKPDNILFDESGELYIADFGIAKASGPDATRLTSSGYAIGTPRYMAPESQLDEQADGRYDQYAVGVILYEALTGEEFRTESKRTRTGIQRRPAIALPEDTPPAVAKVVQRAIHDDPRRRFARCSELAEQFQTAVEASVGSAPRWRSARAAGIAALTLIAIAAVVLWLRPTSHTEEPSPESLRRAARRALARSEWSLALSTIREARALSDDAESRLLETRITEELQARLLAAFQIVEPADQTWHRAAPVTLRYSATSPVQAVRLDGRELDLERGRVDWSPPGEGLHPLGFELLGPQGVTVLARDHRLGLDTQPPDLHVQTERREGSDSVVDLVIVASDEGSGIGAVHVDDQPVPRLGDRWLWSPVIAAGTESVFHIVAADRVGWTKAKEHVVPPLARPRPPVVAVDDEEGPAREAPIASADAPPGREEEDEESAAVDGGEELAENSDEPTRDEDSTPVLRATGLTELGPDPDTGLLRYRHEQTGIVLVRLPGGTAKIGSPHGESGHQADEEPCEVLLSPFLIATTECTQQQWDTVGPDIAWRYPGRNMPVDSVSWDDCQAFLEQTRPRLRLPSEMQWEYACRAGSETPFAHGSTLSGNEANFSSTEPYGKGVPPMENEGRPVRVAGYRPNPWGLYDMHGNQREWCQDYYAPYPENPPRDYVLEVDPGNGYRVSRGGSFQGSGHYLRSACRTDRPSTNRDAWVGLRPVLLLADLDD